MIIYFISGLGADKQVFSKLSFPDSFVLKYIDWIDPIPNEQLSEYSLRLSKEIDTSQEFCLIGLSFGGIIVTELKKILKPKSTIIISSISTRSDIPWIYKFAGYLRINKIMPANLLLKPNAITYWYFGASQPEEKQFLKRMLANTSPKFLKWAINGIVHWQNTKKLEGLVHIHGSADRILPYKKIRPDIMVKGGGHLMIYTHAEIMNKLILNQLGFS